MEARHARGVGSGVSWMVTRALRRPGQTHVVIPDLRKVLQRQKNSVPEVGTYDKEGNGAHRSYQAAWGITLMTVLQLCAQGTCQHSDHCSKPRLVTLRSLTPHRYRPASRTHATAPTHPQDFCGSSTQQTPHAPSTHSTGSRALSARSSAVARGSPWYSVA